MAQSLEARLNKQVSDALVRQDFNFGQFATGTTAYSPFVINRLALLVYYIGQAHKIDYEYGIFTHEDIDAKRWLAGVYRNSQKSVDNMPPGLVT
jgi:hypothetical protein